jgi:hypothetical protein
MAIKNTKIRGHGIEAKFWPKGESQPADVIPMARRG